MSDFDISFFSLSKLSGHAGTRFGWAIVKDAALANLMGQYIGNQHLHVSVDSIHRAVSIINTITESPDQFFGWVRSKMMQRWQMFDDFVARSQGHFTQLGRVGSFYPWIRCNTAPDCAALFASVGVHVSPGPAFGASPAYARLELVQYTQLFNMMMQRLEKLPFILASSSTKSNVNA